MTAPALIERPLPHRRPQCVGCGRTCLTDEGYRTTNGFVPCHDVCLERRRPMWMASGGRA